MKKKVKTSWSKGLTNETDERVRKMSIARSGWHHTEESKKKISEANKGRLVSEEARRKISEAHRGHTYNLGRHHSEETKRKISETKKGCKPSEKTILAAIKVNTGRPCSEETKRKIGNANRGSKNGNYGISLSKEERLHLSNKLRGKNAPNWKGGISLLTHRIRDSFHYRQWRSDIYTRDDFICQECGQRGGRLNAHHIKSFSLILQFYEITTLKEALECEELWNINNGITLCKKCHKI